MLGLAWLLDKVSCLSLLSRTVFLPLPVSMLTLNRGPFPFTDLLLQNCVLRHAYTIVTAPGSWPFQPHLWSSWPWLLALLDLLWPFLFLMSLLWQMPWFLVFDPSLIQWVILLCPLVFPEGELVDCQGSLMIPWGQTVTASCAQAPQQPEGPFSGYSANWGWTVTAVFCQLVFIVLIRYFRSLQCMLMTKQ